MVGEHGQRAMRLSMRPVHVLDKVPAEIPILEPDRVAGLLQHPGDPGGPGTVSLVEADEEVALGGRAVGHGCQPRLLAPRPCSSPGLASSLPRSVANPCMIPRL